MSSQNRLNVVFFPAWYPNEANPLAGKFIINHANAIAKEVEVSIVVIEPDPSLKKIFQLSVVNAFGFETVVLKFKKIKPRFLRPLNAVSYLLASFYLLVKERERYQSAHLNHVHVLTRTALLPFLVKVFLGVPYVISEHWSRYLPERNTYKGFLRKLVTKFFVRRSVGVATVSKSLKLAMLRFGLSHPNFQVISNVLDTSLFMPAIRVDEVFSILHVSGLNDEVKNVSGILRAAKILSQNNYQFMLTIVGDDLEEGPVIRKYAEDIGLFNVKFMGKIYGSELVRQYQQADVFVLNSNFETQSCVILEAMSCAVPVIATSVGGVPEIITDETGLLIEANNDEMLANAIANVFDKKIIFDKEKVRTYATTNYGPKAVSSAMLRFYENALSLNAPNGHTL